MTKLVLKKYTNAKQVILGTRKQYKFSPDFEKGLLKGRGGNQKCLVLVDSYSK